MLSTIENQLFAIMFAASEPVEGTQLAQAVEATGEEVNKIMINLKDKLEENKLPLQLLKLGSKYQLTTCKEYASVIKKALDIRRNIPLSQAAMEVLAIIAYNQPVTKSFVEQVRGVDSSSVVNSLEEKGLIEEAGRLELPGRPVSYKTNANFLRCFGISSLEDLPEIGSEQEEEEYSTEDFPIEDPEKQLDFDDVED